MQTDFAATVNTIANLAEDRRKRFDVIKENGRVFIADETTGTTTEVLPRFENLAPMLPGPIRCASLMDVLAWAKTNGQPSGVVTLSRTGDTVAMTPARVAIGGGRDSVLRPFNREFMPPTGWMGIDEFREWFTLVRSGLDEAALDRWELSLAAIQATTSEVVEIVTSGAVISTRYKREDGVGSQQMPRTLATVIPFGDVEFKTSVRFVVTAKVTDKVVRFRVAHDQADGALDAYLRWARQMTEAAGLGKEWLVVGTV